MILWPEVAVPALLEQDLSSRLAIASLLGPKDDMILGAQSVRFNADGDAVSASNSAFGLDPFAHLFGRYDKAHLVPYGEYLPMRRSCRRSACRGWRRATWISTPAPVRATSSSRGWAGSACKSATR